MAKLALVYGVRLLPSDDIQSFENAAIALKDGKNVRVTMHTIEGDSKLELKDQLLRSLDAFFDFYPEI